jgi:methylated-DNA-[protein]-cysteine S-methyltransferase
LGDRKKARAVGTANSRNPLAIVVPCHRVIAASGDLSGFGGGVKVKKFLLSLEQTRG